MLQLYYSVILVYPDALLNKILVKPLYCHSAVGLAVMMIYWSKLSTSPVEKLGNDYVWRDF